MNDSVSLTPPVSARDHIEGHEDAPVILVEYGDYQCPYCGLAHPVIKRLRKSLGKKRSSILLSIKSERHHTARIVMSG